MGYKNHPAYQAYLNGGVRPDPRLLPRVQQNTDGQYFINPGERYCRWVEPDGMICSQDKLFLSPSNLRNHYFRVHEKVLEKRQDGRNKGMTEDDLVRWYSALTANIAHDWSPRKAKERGKSPPPQPKPSLLSLMGGEPTPLYGPGSDPVPEEDSDDGPPNDSPTALRSQRANHSSEAREPTEGDDSHIVPESDSPGPSNRSKRPAHILPHMHTQKSASYKLPTVMSSQNIVSSPSGIPFSLAIEFWSMLPHQSRLLLISSTTDGIITYIRKQNLYTLKTFLEHY
ncbi:uncharacterized protein FMAN_16112 [Fusarium mangiferae]|uniref:Uncharacterized protein n=1 Tax=Fusarium mangiferae TaxID=192010 RepID=A0A1L7T173_FUSMA|nr:uncharacterized protein FMAN_16112 [Fusarium mangiferae]CVK92510.1 uncharacterized protein FMAN_16112 [Fusarium mangiferae]